MKIGNYFFELKKINHIEMLSKETYCFSAILCVNGTEVAYCENTGHGSPTNVAFFPEHDQLKQEIIDFLKSQLKLETKSFDYKLESNLEYVVDLLVEKVVVAKELKRIMNQTKENLVFKTSESTYLVLGWDNFTIEKFLQTPKYCKEVKETIASVMMPGITLMNENIPTNLLPQKYQSNDIVEKYSGMSLEQLNKEASYYVLQHCGTSESDFSINDISRAIIHAFAHLHSQCYLGSINLRDKERQNSNYQFVPYTGQKIYNFQYEFVIPDFNEELLQLVIEHNRPKEIYDSKKNIDRIQEMIKMIETLGGINLLWA